MFAAGLLAGHASVAFVGVSTLVFARIVTHAIDRLVRFLVLLGSDPGIV